MLEARKKEACTRARATALKEKRTQKEKGKERSVVQSEHIKAYRVVVARYTSKRVSGTNQRECKTCGNPGHRTRKRTRMCRHGQSDTPGRMPKCKHRRHPETVRFIIQHLIPYLDWLDSDPSNESSNRTCNWCEVTFATKQKRQRHDSLCSRGRQHPRLGCRNPGCVRHYDTNVARIDHEKRCKVTICNTRGCATVLRTRTEQARHARACTFNETCKCGTTFANAEYTSKGWIALRTKNGLRKYNVEAGLNKHK